MGYKQLESVQVYQSLFRTVVLAMVVALAACSDEQAPQKQSAESAPENATKEAGRFDIARISHGAMLFQQNCAECHGPEAQGHPDWKEARSRGYSAAPPLDGTGHAHKLKKAELNIEYLEGEWKRIHGGSED